MYFNKKILFLLLVFASFCMTCGKEENGIAADPSVTPNNPENIPECIPCSSPSKQEEESKDFAKGRSYIVYYTSTGKETQKFINKDAKSIELSGGGC